MMEHDGENLKKAIKEAGLLIGYFSDQMGVGRNTATRWFDTPNLPIDKLIKAAKLLKCEPAELFPRLKKVVPVAQALPSQAAEDAPRPPYGNGADALQKCTEDRAKWQNRAYDWMEKYTVLLESHTQLLTARLENPGKKTGEWLIKGTNPLPLLADCCPVVAHFPVTA